MKSYLKIRFQFRSFDFAKNLNTKYDSWCYDWYNI